MQRDNDLALKLNFYLLSPQNSGIADNISDDPVLADFPVQECIILQTYIRVYNLYNYYCGTPPEN